VDPGRVVVVVVVVTRPDVVVPRSLGAGVGAGSGSVVGASSGGSVVRDGAVVVVTDGASGFPTVRAGDAGSGRTSR
jgi:hypothetical protein